MCLALGLGEFYEGRPELTRWLVITRAAPREEGHVSSVPTEPPHGSPCPSASLAKEGREEN